MNQALNLLREVIAEPIYIDSGPNAGVGWGFTECRFCGAYSHAGHGSTCMYVKIKAYLDDQVPKWSLH